MPRNPARSGQVLPLGRVHSGRVVLAIETIGCLVPKTDFKGRVHSVFARARNVALDDAMLAIEMKAERHAAEGHFGAESMGPGIEALLRFVKGRPGGRGVITNAGNIGRALRSETGTWIQG